MWSSDANEASLVHQCGFPQWHVQSVQPVGHLRSPARSSLSVALESSWGGKVAPRKSWPRWKWCFSLRVLCSFASWWLFCRSSASTPEGEDIGEVAKRIEMVNLVKKDELFSVYTRFYVSITFETSQLIFFLGYLFYGTMTREWKSIDGGLFCFSKMLTRQNLFRLYLVSRGFEVRRCDEALLEFNYFLIIFPRSIIYLDINVFQFDRQRRRRLLAGLLMFVSIVSGP